MRLAEVQRPYDWFVSLGSACSPAAHLRQRGLRKFSMPLDWVVCNLLSDVRRTFECRFAGYMNLANMKPVEGSAKHYDEDLPSQLAADAANTRFIRDTEFNVLSVHDFPITDGQPWEAHYPYFRNKLDARVRRLLSSLSEAESVLFVRWADPTGDAMATRATLSGLVGGEAHLLVLQPVPTTIEVRDREIEAEDVCLVEVPNTPADNAIWDRVLHGMSLTQP